MKQQSKLDCGGKRLDTDNLEDASQWILDNIAGLRTFELQIEIRSKDLGCDMSKNDNKPPVKKTILVFDDEEYELKGVEDG